MKVLKKIFSYFKESKDELLKVVWPTRKHVIEVTTVVVILVVVMGLNPEADMTTSTARS